MPQPLDTIIIGAGTAGLAALREVRKFDAAFGSGALASQAGRDFIHSV